MLRLLLPLLLATLVGCPDTGDTKPGDTDGPGGGNLDGDIDDDGFTTDAGDCDDNDAAVNPAATEICNGIDDDCNATVDEGVQQQYFQDFDSDGFGNADVAVDACEAPTGYVQNGTDCNDAERAAFPGNNEICDEIDNDCDGRVDNGVTTTFYADGDGDTYGDPGASLEACDQPVGYVVDATDCNDATNRSYPGNPEICDELDNNCDGTVDEGVTTTYYADRDADNFGDATLTQDACSTPTGYTSNGDDCDDTVATTNPRATEVCNDADDDCDTVVDEDDAADARTWYRDADSDSYGNRAISDVACDQPSGFVADSTDCDDARALSNPGATEYCNTYDDDCDGTVDEDDAADAATWYMDADGDAYGDAATSDIACNQPARYVADSTDCDDGDRTSYPGGTEVCDGADNDCDGTVDDEPTDGNTYYADADGDGFGDEGSTDIECSLPSGYVENPYDCDDADATEPVVADAATGTAGGTGTLASPLASLQDAIDRSYQCVIAYPGTYTEQIDLGGKSIDVWGIEGADYTTIDANMATCSSTNPTGCGPAVTVASGSNAAPVIHGFTITGGTGYVSSTTSSTTCADSSASHNGRNTCTVTTYEYCGGGVYVNGDDPYVYDAIVRDNLLPDFEQADTGSFTQVWLYSYGGGVCLKDSAAVFETTEVVENYADQGGGVYAGDNASFSFAQGWVSENDATDGAGVHLEAATGSFTNSVVHCNTATTDGGGLFTETSGSASFVNTVFYGNASSTSGSARGSEAYIGASTTFLLWNSIVETSFAQYALYGVGSGTLDYNNVYNSTGGTYGGSLTAGANSISSGSNFNRASCDNNPYNDDFSLRSTSSSVNKGDPSAAYNDADGSRNDQGAYGGVAGDW